MVGPFRSGKSALLNLIGGRLKRACKVTGSMTINGKGLKKTWVRPTYLSSQDEVLLNVTVEQALVYTGAPTCLEDCVCRLSWENEG